MRWCYSTVTVYTKALLSLTDNFCYVSLLLSFFFILFLCFFIQLHDIMSNVNQFLDPIQSNYPLLKCISLLPLTKRWNDQNGKIMLYRYLYMYAIANIKVIFHSNFKILMDYAGIDLDSFTSFVLFLTLIFNHRICHILSTANKSYKISVTIILH